MYDDHNERGVSVRAHFRAPQPAIARAQRPFDSRVSALLAASAAVAAFSAFKRACFSLTGQRLNYKVRISLFRTILRQDIAYFDGVNTGDLLSRLSYDVNNLTSPCNTVLSLASQNVVVIVGALIMCFYTCWRLAMVSFAVVMPITYLIKRYARWSQTLNREISAMLGLAATAANEALGNVRTVRATSSEETELARYEEHAGAALRAGVKDAFGGALTVMLTNLLELGTSVLILWLGGGMAMEEPSPRLTIGALITFQLYFNAVTSAYTALTNCLTSLVRAAGSASRVFSLKDNLPDIDPAVGSAYDPGGEPGRGPAIAFENATFWYQMRPNHVVINGLSMRVASGSTAALVGKSGGGKTTLVALLLRYYDVKGGSVRIDGVDLRDLNLASVHKHVGLVAQDTQIFTHTIAGNIEYGCGEKPSQSAIETARRPARDFIQTFPDGYDTRLGERGVRLSGGRGNAWPSRAFSCATPACCCWTRRRRAGRGERSRRAEGDRRAPGDGRPNRAGRRAQAEHGAGRGRDPRRRRREGGRERDARRASRRAGRRVRRAGVAAGKAQGGDSVRGEGGGEVETRLYARKYLYVDRKKTTRPRAKYDASSSSHSLTTT